MANTRTGEEREGEGEGVGEGRGGHELEYLCRVAAGVGSGRIEVTFTTEH